MPVRRISVLSGSFPGFGAVLNLVNANQPTVISEVTKWWRKQRQTTPRLSTLRSLRAVVGEFLRDSLPDRRRQRYGDVGYDWEHRVDTTSANVSWRARFIGLLHSSYQPIEPELFQEMLNRLGVDYGQFTFIDIGSGKGRALLMASEYPFRRVVGVELLPELNRIAQENIRRFPKERQRCGSIEALLGDATQFVFPHEPLVVFMFHPLPETGFRRVLETLRCSMRESSCPVLLIYANPVFEDAVMQAMIFRKDSGTHQYSIFAAM
jgi:SAM-dependent methyltransferase